MLVRTVVAMGIICTGSAWATIVQGLFTGTIASTDPVLSLPVGTPFSGSFGFNTAASSIQLGSNFQDFATGHIVVTIAPLNFLNIGVGETARVSTLSSPFASAVDTVRIAGVTSFGEIDFVVAYPDGSLASLALPTALSPLALGELSFVFKDAQDPNITHVASGFAKISPVPEPTSAAFLGAGLLALIGLRRKRS